MKVVNILLVEDNDGDILLTTEALEESRIINTLTIAKNGKDALDFLYKRGRFSNETLPDLILLDINLPYKNGHEVLTIIKNDDTLKNIPVIMLTTSSSETDINKSYSNYANCYIIKPIEVKEFIAAVISIKNFWLNIVALPNKTNTLINNT